MTLEKVCGLARVVRALVAPVTEGVALWHERDILHSSVERLCVPQAAALTEHQLIEMTGVVTGLEVDSIRMIKNLRSVDGAVFSSELLSLLVEQRVPRWTAHELLSQAASGDRSDLEKFICEKARENGVALAPENLVDQALARLRESRSLDGLFQRLATL